LLDLSKGQAPKPITDNELNEIRNLRKKVEYFKAKLEEGGMEEEENSEQSEEEEEVGEVQPKKKNVKAQRAGVSAEVYGDWNKKGHFQPKVVHKNPQTKEKLKVRLLQAFMFNALDPKEFEIVVDAIEEVKVQEGDVVIREGD
jgi:cAMP-dependent protein kinase regulator